MTREFTCIVCPNGCRITVEYEIPAAAGSSAPVIRSISGNLCPRGIGYVTQELTDPRRTIATSVLVEGGELPLASVRLTAPIPRATAARAYSVLLSSSPRRRPSSIAL